MRKTRSWSACQGYSESELSVQSHRISLPKDAEILGSFWHDLEVILTWRDN